MNRDTELQLLLAKLRAAQPGEFQINKWQAAVSKELEMYPVTRIRRFSWATQLAAVLTTGFLLGMLSAHQFFPKEEKREPVATVQYTFSNSD